MRKIRFVAILALFIFFGLIGSNSLYAVSVTLQDGLSSYTGTRDTHIFSQTNKQHDDSGTQADLLVRKKTDNEKRSLIFFDLSGLPAFGTILSLNSATLSLYKPSGDQKAFAITAYRITNGPWKEGDGDNNTNDHADWHHRVHNTTSWVTAGLGSTDYDTTSGVTTVITNNNAWYDWSVTGIVNSWWSGANVNYGFYLLGTGVEGERKFNSSEDSVTGKRPKLTIDYSTIGPTTVIPEPATMLLFGLSTLGLGFFRRKRK